HTCYVRASNGIAGQEVNSDPKTFTIAGGIAQGVPTAWWPKGNPVVYTNTPTLNWTVAGSTIGLTKFRVAWSTTPSPDWSTLPSTNYSDITDVTQRSFILPAQAYGAHIYWAIAAYAGSTPSAWSAGDFTITGGTGTIVPIVSYPTGGTTVYSTSTSLSWYISGSSIGIQSYKVEYGNRSDFSDATIVNSSSSTTTISNLTPGATYYWRVSAYNGTSYSAPSNPVGRFTVIGGSGSVVPFAGSPVEGVVLTSASPELSWLLPAKTDANLKYELQYSTDNEMTSPVTISEIQQTSVTVSGLQAGTEYYWRVRSVDEKGNYSSYSAPGRFTVTATTDVTVDNAIPTEYKIDQNYPNPFNPSTMITYWLPKNSFVKLQVFDMLGREIKTLIAGQMNAGKHTAQWNADDNSGQKVSSGMYLYRLSTNETVITRKMILLR
ncbi:MAG: fibronectin type III domain-containing protein, partial [Ignavibacteriales bacterium]